MISFSIKTDQKTRMVFVYSTWSFHVIITLKRTPNIKTKNVSTMYLLQILKYAINFHKKSLNNMCERVATID